MPAKIVRQLDLAQWRDFVEGLPAGNIFHTPEMFHLFERAERHWPSLWTAVDENHRPLALLLPVRVTLGDGLSSWFTTRAVAYGSVLCAPEPEAQDALVTLLDTYKREVKGAPLFTELRNLSDLSSIQPILQEQGFTFERHVNFLIDLQRPVEEIWKSVRSNVRTNVRKARRMGVVVEEVTSLDKLPAVYGVLSKVYQHIRVPLATSSLFEAAFEILYPRNMIKVLLARAEDTYVGTAIRLLYKGVIYAWYAGSLREYSSCKANDLLNWHILEWGARNGYRCFDFGGAGKPDEDYGPGKYKAKFGGELVGFGRNTCVHSALRLWVSTVGYRLYRRFP